MSFKKWQIKAMVYALLVAIVPVRHSGQIHIFAQVVVGMMTGSIS